MRKLWLCVPLLLAADAGLAGEWRLSGSNTLRIDRYWITGNTDASPFPYRGTHAFNDLQLGLVGRTAPQSLWRFQFAGVLNDSAYRSEEQGLVAERMSLGYERGDGVMPLRFELGDQFIDQSPLTLRKVLKAGRLELLPPSAVDDRQHSLALFAGVDDTSWNDLSTDSQFRGVSWAVADNAAGRLSANFVQHAQAGEDGDADHSEWVGSVMAERRFDFAHQRLLARGEVARFRGGSGEQELRDNAISATLSGRDEGRGLNYELTYERFGEEFAPAGVELARDYRSMAARAGIELGGGLVLQGRAQRATHDVSGADPVAVDSVGMSVQGPLASYRERPVDSVADVTVHARESESGLIESRAATAKVDFGLSLADIGTTRLGALWSMFDNRLQPGRERTTRQFSLDQGLQTQLGDYQLEARVGVVYREIDGTRPQEYVNPTLSLVASGQAHRFGVNLGLRRFETALDDIADVDTYALGMSYQFRYRRHTLGLDIDHELRTPEGLEDTSSWRVGAYWRYSFDHGFSG